MAKWPIKRMNSLCDVTSSKRVYAKDLCASGVPFYRSTEIIEKLSGQTPSNSLFISEQHFQRILETVGAPSKGDLLLTSRGTLGVPYIVKATDRFHFADGNLTWFRNFKELNSHFLKYFLLSPSGRAELKRCIIGSSQLAYTISALKNITIPLPCLPIQDRIASVLSAYDNLIENNTRRIKILEEMAQMIYREWFVNFRFPGHEKVRMVESELGKIPEGWQIATIGDLVEYHIGGGWGQDGPDESFPVSAYVIRGTDVPEVRRGNLSKCPLRFHKESNFRTRRLQPEDIIFEVSGGSKGQPVGRAVWLDPAILTAFGGNVICASFCKLIRCDKSRIGSIHFYQYLLDSYTNGEIEKYQVQSTGISNFKFKVFLDGSTMVVPTELIEQKFASQIEPIMAQIAVLGKKSSILRETRDFLLPKLISGEINVDQLETEPVAAAAAT